MDAAVSGLLASNGKSGMHIRNAVDEGVSKRLTRTLGSA